MSTSLSDEILGRLPDIRAAAVPVGHKVTFVLCLLKGGLNNPRPRLSREDAVEIALGLGCRPSTVRRIHAANRY
jgi:hypothetical protein